MNCPCGKWKLDRERKRESIALGSQRLVAHTAQPWKTQGWLLTLHSPGRHSCSHEKQARPLVSSRCKPQSLTAKPAPFTLTYLELLGQCHLSSSGSAGGHTTQGKPWRSRQTRQNLQTALWGQWYVGVWMNRPVPWLCTLKTSYLSTSQS